MSDGWKYQLRILLAPELARVARRDPNDPALKPLADVLAGYGAVAKCQFDAFSDYVAEAERLGPEGYPLYEWTKATIADPVKQAKYIAWFTIYVRGEEVYEKETADGLEVGLRPLLESGLISRLSKYDTNPANNPQPPRRGPEVR
jgi:hypothetical protein